MLEGRNLSFRYHPKKDWILKNISLTVSPGQVIGLKGMSGEGKTTLGKIMAGYLRPDSGFIQVDKYPLPKKGVSPVQMIFQHPELSVNPKWRIHKILSEGIAGNQTLLMDEFGLSPSFLNRYPHELSGGELQRIVIGRSLGKDTRYLIADEITAMLDAITQAQIWHTIMTSIKKRNIGVLAISHDENLLNRICDDCLHIRDLNN
ncbi:MAG: ATP-binding cassette domain-containing protein [Proteobacteria bacterium]|nr:ATP-binding cassette domain-containing protein [Pseudomonadota bacterium]